MENAMILSRVNAALPTLMKNFSYDEFDRMFQTPAYVTDRAAYYQGARVSDKIAVVFNLANGYCYRFLGLFKVNGEESRNRGCCVWQRTASKLDLPPPAALVQWAAARRARAKRLGPRRHRGGFRLLRV